MRYKIDPEYQDMMRRLRVMEGLAKQLCAEADGMLPDPLLTNDYKIQQHAIGNDQAVTMMMNDAKVVFIKARELVQAGTYTPYEGLMIVAQLAEYFSTLAFHAFLEERMKEGDDDKGEGKGGSITPIR